MIIKGYIKSYKLPVKILRPNNIYGTRQHPEKLIAGFFWCVVKNKKFTLHGNGNQKRTFLYVGDFCQSVDLVFRKGKKGEIYNVGTEEEFKNLELIKLMCQISGMNLRDYIKKIPDRLFNDSRYSIDLSKIKKLGWKSENNLKKILPEIFNWTKMNHNNFSR